MPPPNLAGDRPIRVAVVQPSLAKYRVAAFRALAARPGIDLTVVYDEHATLPSASADGFRAICEPMAFRSVAGRPVYWHGPQWRYATASRSDAVVLNWDVHYALLAPAILRARRAGVGTVLWGHGYSKRGSGWRDALRLRLGRMADCVMVYGRVAAGRLVDEGGYDPARVFVALNSLDQTEAAAARERWRADPEGLAVFQREHGLAGRPVVLFVSRLEEANRLDLLLDAAAILKGRPGLAGLRVVIVGKGDAEADVRRRAADLGMADALVMPGPIYDESALAPYFLSATAYAYPTNMGLSLLHALGYGLPVVTGDDRTQHGPEVEALIDGTNGLTFRHGSADALADALGRLLTDTALRDRLSIGATRTATEEFTIARMIDGFEAAIRFAHAEALGR